MYVILSPSLPPSFPLGWGHPPNRHLFTRLFCAVCEGVSRVVHQADHQEAAREKPHQYQVSPEATVQPCLPPQRSKEARRCPHFQQHLHCIQVGMRLLSTVDWEIFTLKIIRVKNFCVDKFSRFRLILEIFLHTMFYSRVKFLWLVSTVKLF